jgi:S1-C subfamily serine protease
LDALTAFSQGLAALVETAGASVVRVEARRTAATGTIWTSDGLVVTAHHVVEPDDGLAIGLADGTTVAASLVGRDPATDVALLRTQAPGLPAPTWADPDDLRVGHVVLALARPGRTVRASLGIVSAIGAEWRTPAGGSLDRYIQADLRRSRGMSGGPLVDVSGAVRGLVTTGVLPRVALVLPVPTLRRVVDALLAHGRVRRGYLGVGAQPVRLPGGLREHTRQETGLLVVAVEPNGPADQGGVLLGDTIVALDGEPVRDIRDLQECLAAERIGTTATVRIIRGGQVQDRTVPIGERP